MHLRSLLWNRISASAFRFGSLSPDTLSYAAGRQQRALFHWKSSEGVHGSTHPCAIPAPCIQRPSRQVPSHVDRACDPRTWIERHRRERLICDSPKQEHMRRRYRDIETILRRQMERGNAPNMKLARESSTSVTPRPKRTTGRLARVDGWATIHADYLLPLTQ